MKRILKQFLQRDAHPIIQFIKYASPAVCHVVDILVFYFLSWKVFPRLPRRRSGQVLNISVVEIDEVTRCDIPVDRVITFFFSNLTAYIVNIFWVFKPGRHKSGEFALFYASRCSVFRGYVPRLVFIAVFKMTTTAAYWQICLPLSWSITRVVRLVFKDREYDMSPFCDGNYR